MDKTVFLISSLILSVFSFMPAVPCQSYMCNVKSPPPSPWCPPMRSWGAAGRTQETISAGRTSPGDSACRSSDTDPVGSPLLDLFPFIDVWLVLGGFWNWTQYCRCGLTSNELRGIIPSFHLQAMPLLIHLRMLPAVFAARARCWLMSSLLSAKTPGPFPQSCSPTSFLSFIYPPFQTVKSQLANKNIVGKNVSWLSSLLSK